MKKIICLFLVLFLMSGCSSIGKEIIDDEETYLSLIENVLAHDNFETYSNYFDIKTSMAQIEDGYRFYVTIDNPTKALYDIEVLAVEKDVDYTDNMAASIGIFDEQQYCLIPNQTNVDRGYVEGLVVSGISSHSETTLYIYVSFKNEDHSKIHSEYLKLDVKY